MAITVERLAAISGAPLANVVASWAALLSSLTKYDIDSVPTQIAAAATVSVECPPFLPIREYGGAAYFKRMYDIEGDRPDKARELGNLEPGDGMRYCGRGFIQITGRANYRKYGHILGIDLEGNPDLALQPAVAADILALYFRDHHIDVEAEHGNWAKVRKLVNGGTNGVNRFLDVVRGLEQ